MHLVYRKYLHERALPIFKPCACMSYHIIRLGPQAASYGDRNLNNVKNYQKLQQFLFKGALKASNMYLLNSLVEQVETSFEKRPEKGQTALFINMFNLGKFIFTEVIELSISSNKKMIKRQEKE